MRLLGLVFDSELSWWPLVLDLVKRCNCKIWSLAKLRDAGASEDQLLALYIARVRQTVEYGAQVYGVVVNQSQSNALERVQVRCLQIVRGTNSSSYAKNLTALGLVTLEKRRELLMKEFAIKAYASPEHNWWFLPHPDPPLNTRTEVPRFWVPSGNTMREECRPFF